MKSLSKNYLINLAYQMMITLLPFITTPYLARVLGADKLGAYSYAHSFVSYFTLFAVMGTTLYGQLTIAKAQVQRASKKQIFTELFLLRAINVTCALIIYYLTVFQFADDKLLYIVAAIEILAVAFDISWVYQGIEAFGKIVVCNAISKAIFSIAIFTLVKSRDDLHLYVFIFGSTLLLGNLLQWFSLPAVLGGGKLDRLNIMRHIKPSLMLLLSHIAIQVYTVVDKTMIGLISKSDYESGYYDQARRLVTALTSIVTSVGTVMASRITMVWNSGKVGHKDEINELIVFSFRLGLALGFPITVGLFVIANRFVPLFWGEGYEPLILMLKILVWIIPVIVCSNIIGMQLLVPSGRKNLMTRSVMIGAVCNFVMNLILITKMNALGAIIASVISEIIVSAVQLFEVRHELPLKKNLQGNSQICFLLCNHRLSCIPSLWNRTTESGRYGTDYHSLRSCLLHHARFDKRPRTQHFFRNKSQT